METVFSIVKLRFGGGLNSRGHREQRRELLIKVVLHNIESLRSENRSPGSWSSHAP